MTRAQQLRAEVSEIAHESFDGAMVVKTLGREGEETERFAAKARELRDVDDPGRPDPRRCSTRRSTACPTSASSWCWPSASTGCSTARPTPATWSPSPTCSPSSRSRSARSAGCSASSRAASSASTGSPRCSRPPARCSTATRAPTACRRPARGRATSPTPTTPDAAAAATTSRSASSPGRTVALVGATASGKSTLTTLLTRLVDPDGGPDQVDGTDLRDLSHGELARSVVRGRRRPRSSSTTPSAATSPSAPTSPTRTSGQRCAPPRPTASSPPCPTASTPSWASAAPRSPAASGSGSRWPGRSSAGRGC